MLGFIGYQFGYVRDLFCWKCVVAVVLCWCVRFWSTDCCYLRSA